MLGQVEISAATVLLKKVFFLNLEKQNLYSLLSLSGTTFLLDRHPGSPGFLGVFVL